MSFKRNRRSEVCDITRNPTAGETGITVIAADLPCTPRYPASQSIWGQKVVLSTEIEAFEVYTTFNQVISTGMTLTLDGVAHRIKRTKQYPPRAPRTGYTLLLIEEF